MNQGSTQSVQRVHDLADARVELQVLLKHSFVLRCPVGVRLDQALGLCPAMDVVGMQHANGAAGQKGIAIRSAHRHFVQRLRDTADVGDDLQPSVGFRATADRDDAVHGRAHFREREQVVADAETDTLQHRAKDLLASVGQVETGDQAARIRVVDRRAFAAEVRQHQQAARAGRSLRSSLEQCVVGKCRVEISGQLVPEPAREAAGRAHACGQRAAARRRAGNRPHPRVRRGRRLGQHEERGAAVHQHQIAGLGRADADGLAQRINGAERDRCALCQTGFARRGRMQRPGEFIGPAELRQKVERRHSRRVTIVPLGCCRVVKRHEVAGRVPVHAQAAGRPEHEVGGRRAQPGGRAPHLGLVLAQPADLRPDRLAAQRHQRERLDVGRTDFGFELGDLGGRARVDAVQDARSQRPHRPIQRHQARPDRAHREPGDRRRLDA